MLKTDFPEKQFFACVGGRGHYCPEKLVLGGKKRKQKKEGKKKDREELTLYLTNPTLAGLVTSTVQSIVSCATVQ